MKHYKLMFPFILLVLLLVTASVAEKESKVDIVQEITKADELVKEPKVYVDPEDDTRKIVEVAPFNEEGFVKTDVVKDPDPVYTERYQSLYLHFKNVDFEKYSGEVVLKKGGRIQEGMKGVLINGEKLVLDFLGCVDFMDDQCGLRVNGPPMGRLKEGMEIQLNEDVSLRVKELTGLVCDSMFCDMSQEAYSTLVLEVEA